MVDNSSGTNSYPISESFGFKNIDNNWYIGNNQTINIENRTLILTGDLIINSTGVLNLNNVTLIFNNSNINSYKISVESGGCLNIESSKVTTIKGYHGSIIFYNINSSGTIQRSVISNLWLNQTKSAALSPNIKIIGASIISHTTELEIKDTKIEGSDLGLSIENCSPDLENITFDDCKNGLYGNFAKFDVRNSRFSCINSDISLINKSNVSIIDTDIDSSDLDKDSKILLKNTFSLKVQFKSPYIKPINDVEVLVQTNGINIYSTKGFNGNDSCTNDIGEINDIIVTRGIITNERLKQFKSKFSVKYFTRQIINKTISFNEAAPIYEIINFDNSLPYLTQMTVTPWSGNTDTEFCYEIIYVDKDNDKPLIMQVQIDDSLNNMTLSNPASSDKIDFRNGSTYQFKTNLGDGDHKFRFVANDGLGFHNIYAPTGSINSIDGPKVVKKNSDPVLSDGSVSRKTGYTNTKFTYRIKYWDLEGDKPVIAKIYIDNISHKMVPVDGGSINEQNISSNGIWYKYSTYLPIGDHEFFYKFKDENNSKIVFYPTNDQNDVDIATITGPKVIPFDNRAPQLGNGSVTPSMGYRFNLYSFTISYFDFESDLPTSAIIVIDDIPHNLSRARIAQDIYFYETFLPIGEHYYHFEFFDDINSHYVRFPSESDLEIIGPIVIDVPPKILSNGVAPKNGDTNSEFVFKFYYQDLENDPPIYAKIYIDNQSFDLLAKSNTPQTNNYEVNSTPNPGILTWSLRYSTKLDLGKHSFYLTLKSRDYNIRYPKSGYLPGPEVIELSNKEIETENNKENETEVTDPNKKWDKNNDPEDSNNDHTETDFDDQINLNTSENENSEPRLNIISFGANNIDGFPKYAINFNLICNVKVAIRSDIKCWLYIDNKPILMTISYNKTGNIYSFNLLLELSPGEHFYHFLIEFDFKEDRLPFKGEFQIKISGSDEDKLTNNGSDNFVFGQFSAENSNDLMKFLFLILLGISITYSIIYRKYHRFKKIIKK